MKKPKDVVCIRCKDVWPDFLMFKDLCPNCRTDIILERLAQIKEHKLKDLRRDIEQ